MVAYGEHVAQRWWSEMSPRGFPIGTCREGTAPAEKGPSRVESRRAGDEAERTRVWVAALHITEPEPKTEPKKSKP